MPDDPVAITLKAIQFWANKARGTLDGSSITDKYEMSEADLDTLATDLGLTTARTLIEGTLGQA